MIWTDWPWTADPQTRAALAGCDRCQAEIYGEAEADEDEHGHVYCRECREKLAAENDRAEAALEVMEAVDGELKKYLSDELRNTVWNTMARRFRLPKEA